MVSDTASGADGTIFVILRSRQCKVLSYSSLWYCDSVGLRIISNMKYKHWRISYEQCDTSLIYLMLDQWSCRHRTFDLTLCNWQVPWSAGTEVLIPLVESSVTYQCRMVNRLITIWYSTQPRSLENWRSMCWLSTPELSMRYLAPLKWPRRKVSLELSFKKHGSSRNKWSKYNLQNHRDTSLGIPSIWRW